MFAKFFNHKEHKEHKEMKGGNGATNGSVVTLRRDRVRRAAREKLTRRRGGAEEVREEMEGGNEVSEANGITQFAEGEPKRLSRARTRLSPVRGRVARPTASAVQYF